MGMKNKNKNKMKNEKGMTLLEMIIVIAIIGMMTGIAIVQLGRSRVDTRLRAAQTEVASTIKLAQSFAIQGKAQSAPICGYGIRFTANDTYEIFYQPLGGNTDCEDKNSPHYDYDTLEASLVTGEQHKLPEGVVLDPLLLEGSVIFFDIPHANAFSHDGTSVNKDYEFSSGGEKRILKVGPRGNILSQ
jgi:prepilin-type N-terminal cleavage/methylation domain-containing protein